MMPLIHDINKNPAVIILTLGLIVVVLGFFVAWMFRRQNATHRRWKTLLAGVSTENFEELLRRHIGKNDELETLISDLIVRLNTAEKRLLTSKRFVGVVRFDAFSEVAGEQSFALAILDDRGDGAVISSLVGRTDCRVYCKSLRGGKSERELSREENEAIQVASKSAGVSK